jgi:hypothetical protein
MRKYGHSQLEKKIVFFGVPRSALYTAMIKPDVVEAEPDETCFLSNASTSQRPSSNVSIEMHSMSHKMPYDVEDVTDPLLQQNRPSSASGPPPLPRLRDVLRFAFSMPRL